MSTYACPDTPLWQLIYNGGCLLKEAIDNHNKAFSNLLSHEEKILKASKILIKCLLSGGKIITCGNGGSAAESQHFTAELVGRYKNKRAALASICLNADTAVLTSIANDFDYENIFSRQLESIASKNDVVVLFSTSGRSKNLLNAFKFCKKNGIETISFLGGDGGSLGKLCKNSVVVSSTFTSCIQEVHLFLIHFLCDNIEMALTNAK